MEDGSGLTALFEENRGHLSAVAYRMLGSASEADDAVQEAWVRFNRTDTREVENLGGWLTTVVARVCLDMLRSRRSRREEPLDPKVIGPLVGRSPTAARQLASRARRRVRGGTAKRAADLSRQREVVEAFLAAARAGDFDGLVAVLHPDVVRRVDAAGVPPGTPRELRGAEAVAKGALAGSRRARTAPVAVALVDGSVGVVVAAGGRLSGAIRFRIEGDRILEMDVILDPERLRQLDIGVLDH